jgi:hypothetical protein
MRIKDEFDSRGTLLTVRCWIWTGRGSIGRWGAGWLRKCELS